MSSHPNWVALATVPHTYKRFVHESRSNGAFGEGSAKDRSNNSLSGVDCRAAYEEVLAVPSEDARRDTDQHSVKAPEPTKLHGQHNLKRNQWINALMKEASQNNVQGVAGLLGEERKLNVTDQFGWTMLMCAAHAGASDVVEYLLKAGADIQMRDKGGNTCISLAKRQKHSAILKLFKKCTVPEEEKPETRTEIKKIFCDVCKHHFEETPSNHHKNSTVHLFNSHPRKHTTWYGIPDCNKGFKLLIKSGWDREQGLGPQGSGTKFPPKTVLKQDRKGLGINSGVARVTHFKPCDISAIKVKDRNERRPRRDRKISMKSRMSSEKRKEHYLRRELNF